MKPLLQEELFKKLNSIQRMLKQQKRKPLTVNQAAKYMGMSVSQLYKLTSQKKIAHSKPNNKTLYFTKAALNQYAFKNKIKSHEQMKEEATQIALEMDNKRNNK